MKKQLTFTFNVTPVGKPRMTQRDKWKGRDCVLNYYAFKDQINLLANVQKFKLPDQYIVHFYLPMPESWSQKKKFVMQGEPHQVKPDKDNLEKALMDSLRPGDDQKIWDSHSRKFWSSSPRIEVIVSEIEG